MMEQKIEADTWWVHNREGYSIQVEQFDPEFLRVKDRNDANWTRAVAYIRPDVDDGTVYVRSAADFLAKFTKDDLDNAEIKEV